VVLWSGPGGKGGGGQHFTRGTENHSLVKNTENWTKLVGHHERFLKIFHNCIPRSWVMGFIDPIHWSLVCELRRCGDVAMNKGIF
jgi:hypothetical protein